MESFETIVISLHSCFSILGVSLNLLLLSIMFRHTPPSFSNFGILLKVHVLADLTTSICSAAEMPRMIAIERSILFISYGPCGYIGTSVCYCACVLIFGGEACSFYTVLASFVFRLLVIRGKNPSKGTAAAIVCSIVLPIPSAMMLAIHFARASDDESASLMNKFHPEYGAYTHVVTGQKDAHSLATMAEFFIMVVLVGPMYMAILILRSLIITSIDRQSATLSVNSRKMQRKFMLSAQAMLPILPAFSVSTYLIAFFDIYHHPALESSTSLVAETTIIFSPIIALLYIDQYRNVLISAYRKRLGTKSQNVSLIATSHVL